MDRLRGAVHEANAQLKNGRRFKKVPCLLLVYHDALDVAEDILVASALFGNLTYAAPRENWEAGRLQLTRDGAWNNNKHRSTSALCYVRNNSGRVTAYNPWAESPLSRGLLGEREIVLNPDGIVGIPEPKDPG